MRDKLQNVKVTNRNVIYLIYLAVVEVFGQFQWFSMEGP